MSLSVKGYYFTIYEKYPKYAESRSLICNHRYLRSLNRSIKTLAVNINRKSVNFHCGNNKSKP